MKDIFRSILANFVTATSAQEFRRAQDEDRVVSLLAAFLGRIERGCSALAKLKASEQLPMKVEGY